MINIRKAKIDHNCILCGAEIKRKDHYIDISKQNADLTYSHAAICEKCLTKIIKEKIEEG